MDDVKRLTATYSEDYCEFLEAAYGSGMMSEGGSEAIDHMFANVELKNKTVLDIGAGVGGVAFYLAERYQAQITGIEISESMVKAAQAKTPVALKRLVSFVSYVPPQLPFENNSFDIVYSKGVLVHVKDKLTLFNEVRRVLKPSGYFIIDDWLSPNKNRWGKKLQQMAEAENLILYPETEAGYQDILQAAGFSEITMRDENDNYARYNQAIVDRLKQSSVAEYITTKFGKKDYDLALESYQAIFESMRDRELLVCWFCSRGTATCAL